MRERAALSRRWPRAQPFFLVRWPARWRLVFFVPLAPRPPVSRPRSSTHTSSRNRGAKTQRVRERDRTRAPACAPLRFFDAPSALERPRHPAFAASTAWPCPFPFLPRQTRGASAVVCNTSLYRSRPTFFLSLLLGFEGGGRSRFVSSAARRRLALLLPPPLALSPAAPHSFSLLDPTHNPSAHTHTRTRALTHPPEGARPHSHSRARAPHKGRKETPPSQPTLAPPLHHHGRRGGDRRGPAARVLQGQLPPGQALQQARPQGCVCFVGAARRKRRRERLLVGFCCSVPLSLFARWLSHASPQLPRLKTHPHHTTEFTQITVKTAVGFLIMGFIGFFVKLLFIVS